MLTFSTSSLQKTPRPLLPTAHDRFLSRWVLSSGPRGQGESRRCWYVLFTEFQSSTLFLCSLSAQQSPCHSPPVLHLQLTFSPGVLTKEFLDFTASRGNNLRSIGLEPGCKWCLCTARWKEAMEAAKSKDDPVVPRCVHSFVPNSPPPSSPIVANLTTAT